MEIVNLSFSLAQLLYEEDDLLAKLRIQATVEVIGLYKIPIPLI